jgi:dTDP-4-amino-4,6-dideoxygalactose transaminase
MEKIIQRNDIFVTQPTLPPLSEYTELLEQIWENKRLTNKAIFHELFEAALAEYLGVKYCSLFCNGTVALQVAIQALALEGEVITTPYSFVATSHALVWNKCVPVFCDIAEGYNLDPRAIKKAITSRTTAIMPVHVYGIPCELEGIRAVAREYGLKILYDAAHAFGVCVNDGSVLNHGDISMLSFHATKVFHTAEGGALVTNDPMLKEKIDYLRNFGFKNETTVVGLGCNGKMNELQAALGLLQLKYIDEAIEFARFRFEHYCERLSNVTGIEILNVPDRIKWNYSYFPIQVTDEFKIKRDELYKVMRDNGIIVRRYFYPLISDMAPYTSNAKSQQDPLRNAKERSERVLCLPLYPELSFDDIDMICNLIKEVAL